MARSRVVKAWTITAIVACACGAAPHGRVAYVVTAKDDTPSGRAALGAQLGAGDDTSGDGFVVRLDDAARARVAAMPAVAAVAPLPASAKRGALPAAGALAVRIDLYADAAPAEVDAVAAWVASHGGAVAARGATWLDATLPAAAAADAAELAEVRWIDARAR
jgi:hypothetical protein